MKQSYKRAIQRGKSWKKDFWPKKCEMVKRIHVQANKFTEENTNNEMAI